MIELSAATQRISARSGDFSATDFAAHVYGLVRTVFRTRLYTICTQSVHESAPKHGKQAALFLHTISMPL